jgi:GxxExxY protein
VAKKPFELPKNVDYDFLFTILTSIQKVALMTLEQEEITRQIIGAAFEVHSVLGYGFLESVYKRAMQVELIKSGLTAELEEPIKVRYKGVVVGDFEADILVDKSVIVELKIAKHYCSEDEAQLLNELKATGVRVGLLINFGREKVEFKRMVF